MAVRSSQDILPESSRKVIPREYRSAENLSLGNTATRPKIPSLGTSASQSILKRKIPNLLPRVDRLIDEKASLGVNTNHQEL